MASYPTSTKAFTTKTNTVDIVDASHINTMQDEVAAVQTDLLSATPVYITKATTGINASALSSGTVPDGRLYGSYANLTSNNTAYAFGKSEAELNVNSAASANNSTYAFGKSETHLNVNSASVANNSTYAYGKSEDALNVNSAASAANATNLNGQPASYYTNASNLTTGTIPETRLSGNVILTTSTTGINASALSAGTVPVAVLPVANDTSGGIVSSTTQTFEGNKTFHADVTITGNLTLLGQTTSLNVNNVIVTDSLIQLAANNTTSDALDIGLYGNYNPDGGAHEHTGLFRDASDGLWKLFQGLQTAPTSTIDITGTGYATATLQSYLTSGGVVANSSGVTITANSSYSGSLTVNTVTAQTLTGNLTGTASNATNLNSQPGSYYTNASNLTTGTLPLAQLSGNVILTTSTTGINASALSTGTVPSARLDANVILTTSTTGINASALSTGTVPSARLSGAYTGLTAITVSNTATVGRVIENFQTYSTAISGSPTIIFDCTAGNLWNVTSTISSNWTANFTNLGLTTNYATSVSLIVNQGAAAYLPTAVQVEGNAVTINWLASTQPTPNANKKDVFAFSILQTAASTYLVMGQLVSF